MLFSLLNMETPQVSRFLKIPRIIDSFPINEFEKPFAGSSFILAVIPLFERALKKSKMMIEVVMK